MQLYFVINYDVGYFSFNCSIAMAYTKHNYASEKTFSSFLLDAWIRARTIISVHETCIFVVSDSFARTARKYTAHTFTVVLFPPFVMWWWSCYTNEHSRTLSPAKSFRTCSNLQMDKYVSVVLCTLITSYRVILVSHI